jgi:hypothetical protein
MNRSFQVYYGKSIRIAPDGFSFFKQDGKRLNVKTFPRTSDALLSMEAPLFFGQEEAVTVIAAQHIPMLVPAEIYLPEKSTEYLTLQYDTSRLGAAYTDDAGEYKAVYFLTQNEKDTIGRLPFSHQIVSETTLFYQILREHDGDSALLVAQNDGFTDLVAVQKGELVFANRYNLVEPVDTLYYICNVIQQFNLRQPQLFLHYFCEENKKLQQLLKTYKLNTQIL